MIRIALDIMGGDLGADATVAGLSDYVSSKDCSDIRFELFGSKLIIDNLLPNYPVVYNYINEIHDTGNKVIGNDDKSIHAIKNGVGTSMYEAIAFVAKGKADAVVSSGNTGAYVALSKILIGTIDGIERPAIVSLLPNISGKTVMLDLGANIDCSATKLIQFALMGMATSKCLLKIEKPRVGLLNIGTEKQKGTEELEMAYEIIKEMKKVNFIGFVEGTDITKGTVDVVVTDGFSGNIALKTMEGTIKYIAHIIKESFTSSVSNKVGYILCRNVFDSFKQSIDPRIHNGAPLVGLKRIAIKSHGNSDRIGDAHAISSAVELSRSQFIDKITKLIDGRDN